MRRQWRMGNDCFSAGRGRMGWDSDFASFAWKSAGGWRGGPFRGGRFFDQGELKYVILRLLAEKPRHGYEVIKAIEEQSGGAYSPSAGSVYPTLQLLEEMGFASSTADESGKRIYAITDAGRAHLEEHTTHADDLFERLASLGAGFFGDAMREVNRAFKDVAKSTYGHVTPRMGNDGFLRDVATILAKAAKEIDDLAAKR